MPRQKLIRKPPTRKGKQGQAQKPGPHDPEHQEGDGLEKAVTEYRHSNQAENDVETDRPRTARKESPL
jgi:hypothetical protein